MGTDLGTTAAVVLAVVFAWAGAAKLGQTTATAEGFSQLGLPGPRVLARLVPGLELLLAVVLVAAPAAGGAAAMVLLAGFSAVLVRALHRGVPVRCACFGQPGGPPLSWVDLVRNGLLAALAALATTAGLAPGAPRPEAVGLVALGALAGAVLLVSLRRRASKS